MKISILWLAAALALAASSASADIVLAPVADGDVFHNALGETATDAGTSISTARSGGNSVRNGIFEFDLSGISVGTAITGAMIEFQQLGVIANTTATANLKVGQYNGDGVVGISDYADYGNFAGDVEIYNTTVNGGPGSGDILTINLDTSTIQSIIDNPGLNFVGLRTATENFATFNFISNEGATASRIAPRLTLQSVPEPNSCAIVSLGLVGLILRRRRNRKNDCGCSSEI